jgi:hypothetical protein
VQAFLSYWYLFNGGFMKTLSTKMTRNTRVAYFALAALAGSQAVYAQDATLTITGNVTTTSCAVRIAGGFGSTNNAAGTGAATASITAPTVIGTTTTTSAAPGAVLSPIVKFTVGLTSAVGAAAACTGATNWNTAFTTATPLTVAGLANRTFLPFTGTGSGAAMELYSYDAAGTTLVQTITAYPAAATGVTYTGGTNVSSQTGLPTVPVASAQTFGVALVKTAAANTALTAGTITGVVTVSYALF